MDGRRVAAASPGHEAVLWDADTGEVLHRFPDPTVWALSFSPDGGRLVMAGGTDLFGRQPGRVTVRDVGDGREVFSLAGVDGLVHGMAYSPEDREVLQQTADGVAHIVRLAERAR